MITSPVQSGHISGQYRLIAANKRREHVLALHVAGLSKAQIAEQLSVSWRTVYRDLIECDDVRVKVKDIIEDCGLDATDVHITLSRMHDADLADIVENPEAPIEQLRYKPIEKWPAIWRQGLAGKVKITPVAIADGERTPGGDVVTYKVEIERESLLKILELSAKLKMVDALAQAKTVDQDNSVTINVVYAEQKNVVQLTDKVE